jgi:1-acyl-sn-glycerol-3-phosphate acyltransferase
MVDVPPMPSEQQLARAFRGTRALATVIQPQVYGIDNVPADGSLLVGNHTIYAFLDLPFMLDEVNRQTGVCVRALGEHAHFGFGPWRDLLVRHGMVRGTRENVRVMMQERQTILVFPRSTTTSAPRRASCWP